MQKSQMLSILFLLIINCCIFFNAKSQATEKIHTIEYFFDIDPGFGSGYQVEVNPANTQLNAFTFNASIGSLSNGIHQLFVRCLDSSSRWSSSTSKLFYKEATISSPTPNVVAAEYFFNTDPGFGNAIPTPVTEAQVVTLTLYSNIGGLPKGMHTVYVRTLDTDGNWSHTRSGFFYREPYVNIPVPNVTQAEYFFDVDPGFGNGTIAAVTPGQDINFAISGNIASLTKGLHTLYVRVKDANNKWSLTHTQLFYKESVVSNSIPNVTAAEYFFDTDPGFGNGNTASITAGQDINFAISGNIASLTKGLHTLYVRVKDANNKWSLSHTQLFYKESVISNPIPNITQAEYFFDTDPGFGNGTAATLTAGQDINFAINGNIASLNKGLHTLYVRVKDANNKWSITHTQLFYREPVINNPVPNITQAEYYFDTDPGFGNASAFTISPQAQNITQAISLPTAGLNKGFHRLVMRVKDANNKWSITNTQLFYYESLVTTPALSNLITLEWFWNSDPGFGNANKVTLPAGNNGQLTDFVLNVPVPFAYSTTLQNFYVRTIDANWSLTTVKLVDFTNVTLPVTLLEFTARADKQNVITSWRTAQEINLKHFIVEHSVDGLRFNPIGTEAAKASAGNTYDYEFVHTNPSIGSNYYRLKQVDNDGKFTYSPIVKINFTSGNRQPIAYPNPVRNILTLSIPMEMFANENYYVLIMDAKKSIVKKLNLTQATSQIELESLASGTYWLILQDRNGKSIWTKTIIKD